MRYIERMAIESVNPTNGEHLHAFAPESDAVIESKLARAAAAFVDWRQRPIAERARLLTRVAEILETDKQSFARLMTTEMGKLVGAAEQEAEKCALGCRYYAAHAEAFL